MEHTRGRSASFSSASEAIPGAHYELRAPLPPHESLSSWPRAGVEDLERALARARAFLDRGGQEQLVRAVPPLLRRLTREPAAPEHGEASFAAALGLTPAEALRHEPYHPLALGAWTEIAPRTCSSERAEVVLLVPHWSELHVGYRRRLARLLAAGHAVVVLAPARVPMVAERFARELASEGLPAGGLEVLFGEGQELLWSALERGGFDLLAASGHRELELLLEKRLEPGVAPRAARPGFGAGVLETARARLAFERLVRSDFHVHLDDDPLERATAAVAFALGRSEALSGQLPGQVGRIACHPRRFSAFTSALLAIVESSPACADPLPPLDPELPRELERVRELGLDEGATLIAEGGPASREARGWGSLFPLVFTNVEPGMRLARLERPMPVLLLQRELPAGPPPAGIALPPARVEEPGT